MNRNRRVRRTVAGNGQRERVARAVRRHTGTDRQPVVGLDGPAAAV